MGVKSRRHSYYCDDGVGPAEQAVQWDYDPLLRNSYVFLGLLVASGLSSLIIPPTPSTTFQCLTRIICQFHVYPALTPTPLSPNAYTPDLPLVSAPVCTCQRGVGSEQMPRDHTSILRIPSASFCFWDPKSSPFLDYSLVLMGPIL